MCGKTMDPSQEKDGIVMEPEVLLPFLVGCANSLCNNFKRGSNCGTLESKAKSEVVYCRLMFHIPSMLKMFYKT